MEPLNITRESVARQLVEKHEKSLAVIKEEFDEYSALEQELDKAAEEYKKDRDSLNEKVQNLKDQRQNYYTESRALRKEFMDQLQKKKSMADIPMEVLILTKQIDHLEWEIQTEAVNIETEKKLVKNIQDNLDKLHDYANKYHDLEEVSKAVKKLTSKLNKRLHQARDRHDEMLKTVNISDEKHKNFVDAVVKLRDARSKRVGFQHDLERHTKALEHWKKVLETESKVGAKAKKDAQKTEKTDKEDENVKTTTEPKIEPKEKGEQKPGQSTKKSELDQKTKPELELKSEKLVKPDRKIQVTPKEASNVQ